MFRIKNPYNILRGDYKLAQTSVKFCTFSEGYPVGRDDFYVENTIVKQIWPVE